MANHPDFKKALANLRKMAKLEAKKLDIEQQIDDLAGDQFMFDEVAFQEALHAHRTETRGILP